MQPHTFYNKYLYCERKKRQKVVIQPKHPFFFPTLSDEPLNGVHINPKVAFQSQNIAVIYKVNNIKRHCPNACQGHGMQCMMVCLSFIH